jgi:soluble lytic murein transglycosylase-like protein
MRRLPALLGLLACAGPHAEAVAGRFECRLARDANWHTVQQDLAQRFPTLVGECRAVAGPAPVPAVATAGEGPGADAPATSVRVISARAPLRRAAAWQAPETWQELIAWSAERHNVDPRLVQAVIQVESAFVPSARSPKGAMGLMQLMPATAQRYGAPSTASLLDPAVNVDVGVRYLRALIDRFGERIELVLAAYNAGEGAVMRHGYKVPPYRETQDYVRKVRRLYDGAQ